MTAEDARLAIVARFDAALAAYAGTKPLAEYENRNQIDLTTQVDPFVCLDIVNMTGKQLDLSPKPMSVQYGQIVLTAKCKENSGSRAAGMLLDYFLPWFELKDFGGVRTHAGMYSPAKLSNGWQGYPITVPFWWTRIAA